MKQTVKNMANLIEIEIKRFSVIYQIINGMEPPIELDAEIMTKRALERGVQAYDGETKSSPVINQVIVSLVSKLDELFQKHTNKGEDQAPSFSNISNLVLQNEQRIFVYRLALINSWALVNLEEIHVHSR